MNTYSIEDLKKMGAGIAKESNAKVLIASNDGQFFTIDNKNAAELHRQQKKGVELFEIEYSEVAVAEEPIVKKTASEKIADIATLETVAAVENYVTGEKAVTVIKAAEERKAAIIQAQADADKLNNRN